MFCKVKNTKSPTLHLHCQLPSKNVKCVSSSTDSLTCKSFSCSTKSLNWTKQLIVAWNPNSLSSVCFSHPHSDRKPSLFCFFSRWSVPMMMSITHRGTGVGLSGGNALLWIHFYDTTINIHKLWASNWCWGEGLGRAFRSPVLIFFFPLRALARITKQ